MHDIDLAIGEVGGVQHHEQLHQFRRLQVGKAQRQPAPRAIDIAPDAGNQHDHQQQAADQEQHGRVFLPGFHPHLERQPPGDHTDGNEDRLADQVVGRLMVSEAAGFCNRD